MGLRRLRRRSSGGEEKGIRRESTNTKSLSGKDVVKGIPKPVPRARTETVPLNDHSPPFLARRRAEIPLFSIIQKRKKKTRKKENLLYKYRFHRHQHLFYFDSTPPPVLTFQPQAFNTKQEPSESPSNKEQSQPSLS